MISVIVIASYPFLGDFGHDDHVSSVFGDFDHGNRVPSILDDFNHGDRVPFV